MSYSSQSKYTELIFLPRDHQNWIIFFNNYYFISQLPANFSMFLLLLLLFVSLIWSILKLLHCTRLVLLFSNDPPILYLFRCVSSGALSIFNLPPPFVARNYFQHLRWPSFLFRFREAKHPSNKYHLFFLFCFLFSSISSPFSLKTSNWAIYSPKSTPIIELLHLRLHRKSPEL
jgi:hypothetical protein